MALSFLAFATWFSSLGVVLSFESLFSVGHVEGLLLEMGFKEWDVRSRKIFSHSSIALRRQ